MSMFLLEQPRVLRARGNTAYGGTLNTDWPSSSGEALSRAPDSISLAPKAITRARSAGVPQAWSGWIRNADLIDCANAAHPDNVRFVHGHGEELSFDGSDLESPGS